MNTSVRTVFFWDRTNWVPGLGTEIIKCRMVCPTNASVRTVFFLRTLLFAGPHVCVLGGGGGHELQYVGGIAQEGVRNVGLRGAPPSLPPLRLACTQLQSAVRWCCHPLPVCSAGPSPPPTSPCGIVSRPDRPSAVAVVGTGAGRGGGGRMGGPCCVCWAPVEGRCTAGTAPCGSR